MLNIITVTDHFPDLSLDLRTCADVNVVGENVRGHRPHALRQAPDMDVMDAKHTVHLDYVIHHFLDIDITRSPFEQNIYRVAQDAPGIVQDKQADQYADERIKPIGVSEIDDHTRDH